MGSLRGQTVRGLAYAIYGGATESNESAVRRALRRLIAEGVAYEQAGYDGQRRLSALAPQRRGHVVRPPTGTLWLGCRQCDTQWHASDSDTCWSCGQAGIRSRPSPI